MENAKDILVKGISQALKENQKGILPIEEHDSLTIEEKELNNSKPYFTYIYGEMKKAYGEHFSVLSPNFLENIKRLLEIEDIDFSYFGENCLQLGDKGFDILVALNQSGVNNLNFLYETLNKKVQGIEIIHSTEHLIFAIQHEGTLLESLAHQTPFKCECKKDIFILRIPKISLSIEILSPKDIDRFYWNIKPILDKYFIKNLSFKNIAYLEKEDIFFIGIAEDYILYSEEDGIKISLEEFLNHGNFYKYKNKSIKFEDYKFLKEAKNG